MFEQFQNWFENRHEYAQEWKARTGGKVLGYFCTYVGADLAGTSRIQYPPNVRGIRLMCSGAVDPV